MARKSDGKRMPPEAYSKILKGVELVDIYLQSCAATLKTINLSLAKGLSLEVKDKASYNARDDKTVVTHTFNLVANQEGAKDYVFKISASFCLVYNSAEPFSEEFFGIFKRTSLAMNSWPYFREFAQSLTQRMGTPPLTLPLIKTA